MPSDSLSPNGNHSATVDADASQLSTSNAPTVTTGPGSSESAINNGVPYNDGNNRGRSMSESEINQWSRANYDLDPFQLKVKVRKASGEKHKAYAILDTGWNGPDVMSEKLAELLHFTIEPLEHTDKNKLIMANGAPFQFRGKVRKVRWEGKSISNGHPPSKHYRRAAMWTDDFFVPKHPLPETGSDIIIGNHTIRKRQFVAVLLAGFDELEGFRPMETFSSSDEDTQVRRESTAKLAAQNNVAKKEQKAEDKEEDTRICGSISPSVCEDDSGLGGESSQGTYPAISSSIGNL